MVAERRKKGQRGHAAAYMTRAKALRKLQLSLTDFRRLCILKGIFPREPRKKRADARHTYYLNKDIQYLAHEPLICKFRELHAHLRKVKRARARREHARAAQLQRSAPVYSLDHLVRERYPTFRDALEDLDDALTTIHLFAEMPQLPMRQKNVSSSGDGYLPIDRRRLDNFARLAHEWQYFVASCPGALRKVFVSVRGYYFEACIQGVRILWAQPHRFHQCVPDEVDLRIMSTFLEFYECLLRMVNFRVYHSILGTRYPPVWNAEQDHADGLLTQRFRTGRAAKVSARRPPTATETRISSERVAAVKAQLPEVVRAAVAEEMDEERPPAEKATVATTAPDATAPELPGDETTHIPLHSNATIFRGMTFFLCRETPVHVLEMVLRACGADAVGFEAVEARASPLVEADARITHVICDRPVEQLPSRRLGREYLQPQWVFDCVNESFRLPHGLYTVGQPLPPHLSPWASLTDVADTELQGEVNAHGEYVPAYRQYLQRIKRGERNVPLPPELSSEAVQEAVTRTETPSAALVEADEEAGAWAEQEAHATDPPAGRPRPAAAAAEPSDRQQLAKMMLSRRKRRLYDRLVARQRRAAQQATALQDKRARLLKPSDSDPHQ